MDPLATETSEFWRNFGPYNDVNPAKIQTQVFRLPCACFAEERTAPGQFGALAAMALEGNGAAGGAKVSTEIMALIFIRLRRAI